MVESKPIPNTSARRTTNGDGKVTSRRRAAQDATVSAVAVKKATTKAPSNAEAKPKTGTKSHAPKKSAATQPTKTTNKTSSTTKSTMKRKNVDDSDAPAAKKTKPSGTTKSANKRKAADDNDVPEAKKTKVDAVPKVPVKPKATPKPRAPSKPKTTKPLPPKHVINQRAADRLDIFVFGEGTNAELGLGTAKRATEVKRPRLNHSLGAENVGVVNISVGGMHTIALTNDNKILTWGVNDNGALGRDTTWDGGLKDMDADASDDSDSDEDDDTGMNPREASPGEVDQAHFPEGTVFTKVAAADSASFALTDDGLVYGWGTFRSNEGIFGFSFDDVKRKKLAQTTPVLIKGLKQITDIACGSDHVLVVDAARNVYAFGNGQSGQLGRRINERHLDVALNPTLVALPKKKIVAIGAGSFHSFAIDSNDNVWAWGLNSFGELGVREGAGDDSATVNVPTKVPGLSGRGVTMVDSGSHHTAAVTKDGECLMLGRVDGGQLGISIDTLPIDDDTKILKAENGRPGALLEPTALPNIDAAFASLSSDHTLVISKDGRAFSTGFGATYQLGQGNGEDVHVATHIDNTAVRGKKLIWAGAGGQFSVLACKHE